MKVKQVPVVLTRDQYIRFECYKDDIGKRRLPQGSPAPAMFLSQSSTPGARETVHMEIWSILMNGHGVRWMWFTRRSPRYRMCITNYGEQTTRRYGSRNYRFSSRLFKKGARHAA